MKDEVDFLPADKHESLLQIDTMILMGIVKHSQSSPNSKFTMSLQYFKKDVRDEVDFWPVDKHQSFLQVDFNTLGIKDPYKVILSLLLDMIKHSQSTESNRFANIFTKSQKRRCEGSSFFAWSKTSKFLQFRIIVFDGNGQILRGSSHVYCYLFPCTARL